MILLKLVLFPVIWYAWPAKHWAMQQLYIPSSPLTRTPELFLAFLHNWTGKLLCIEEGVIVRPQVPSRKSKQRNKNQADYSLEFSQNTLWRQNHIRRVWLECSMADRGSEVTPSDLLQLRSWPAGPSWSERPQGFKLSWLSKGKRVGLTELWSSYTKH